MNPLIAFAAIRKVDEQKRLIYGRAAQQVPDRGDEILDYDKSKPYFAAWSASQLEASMGKSAGNVRYMHGKEAAGIVVPNGIIFNDDEKAVDVVVKVVDDPIWEKVMAGALTGFSIGGKYISKSAPDKDGKITYVGDISEISLVDRPAVPTATFFEVQKADGKIEKREFIKPVMRKLVRRDGKDLGKEIDDRDLPKPGEEFVVGQQRFVLGKVENGKAVVDEVYDLVGTADELNSFAKLVTERGLTIAAVTLLVEENSKAPKVYKITDPEVIAKAAQLAFDKDKADFKKLTPEQQAPHIEAALAEVNKVAARSDTDPKEGEKKYGSVKFADEKNKKYPINTKAHVQAAWSYINMPKNAAKYSAEDLKSIKGKIKAAAKDFGVEINQKLDGAEGDVIREEIIVKLMKALYEPSEKALTEAVAALAKAEGVDLKAIEKLDEAMKKRVEDWSRKAWADLYEKATAEEKATMRKAAERAVLRKGLYTCAVFASLLDQLCQLAESIELETMREGDESGIAEDIYMHIAGLGECLRDCVEEEVREEVEENEDYEQAHGHNAAIYAAADGLVKRVAEILSKKHIAVPIKRIQKIHDAAVASGAICPGKQASNVETAAAQLEAGAQIEELNKIAKVGDVGLGDFVKAEIAKAVAPVAEENKALKGKVEKLEKQPMPAHIAVRAVAKEADTGVAGLASADPAMQRVIDIAAKIPPVMKADGSGIDEVATAMKITRALGGVRVLEQPK